MSRKKEAAAEALNDARNELHSLKAELAEKQQQLRDSDNQGMLKPDEVGQQGSSLRLDQYTGFLLYSIVLYCISSQYKKGPMYWSSLRSMGHVNVENCLSLFSNIS